VKLLKSSEIGKGAFACIDEVEMKKTPIRMASPANHIIRFRNMGFLLIE
jgi:hypothetical protein